MSTIASRIRRLGSVLAGPVAPPQPSPLAALRGDPVRDSGWPTSWSSNRLGQVSGVGVDSVGDVFVFHRAGRVWREPFPTDLIAGETILQLDGRIGSAVSSWGARSFVMPHGLRVDDRDNVWVTDLGRHQVVKMAHDGTVLLTVGEHGVPGCDATHFDRPTDVAVLPDGSFYVSDGYGNSRVAWFSPTGELVSEWGSRGSGPGEFDLPHGIAVDAEGFIYVADRQNSRIQVFGPGGEFVTQWKGRELGRPYGLALSPRGTLYVADGDGSRLVEIDRSGRVLRALGGSLAQDGGCGIAHSVAAAPDGSVYLGDLSGSRVHKWAPDFA